MKNILLVLMLFGTGNFYSQEFINGDFEDNTAVGDNLGLANVTFNAMMEAATGFGTLGNIDILTTTTWLAPGPQSGDWFIGITGGGSDKLTIELDVPFISGQTYTVRFYDCKFQTINANLLSVGVSTSATSLGTEVYQTPTLAVAPSWTEREFTFTAPFDAGFLTLQHVGGSAADWVAIDSFEVLCDLAVDLGPNINTCQGEEVVLNAGLDGATYLWQDGSTDSTFTVTETGLYSVSVNSEVCSFSDVVVVTFVNNPVITLASELTACEGETVTITPTTDLIVVEYDWSTGDSAQTITVNEAGTYSVEISNLGCISEASVEVIFIEYPEIELGEEQLLCYGEIYTLTTGTSGLDYEWQDGSTAETYAVSGPGFYSVTVANGDCSVEDDVEIMFEICDVEYVIPNIFTPNGDEFNGLFQPIISVNVETLTFEVYNRWGLLVYETADPEILWDGKDMSGNDLPSGTYFYIVSYYNEIGDGEERSGTITLLKD